jgi:RNA polymerase sigma factor (sigma-70 family)
MQEPNASFERLRSVTTQPVVEPAPDCSFESVYRAQYSRMVVLARLMTPRGSPAEEIAQDSFLQLFRRWDAVTQPLAYLRVSVVNGCRSYGRRRALERRRPSPQPEARDLDTVAIAVRDALDALTPRQRAAVVLRYYDDLSEREIASVLSCRPGTVKSLLSRGLRTMKEHLDD